jgi:hypothetical protein
MRGQVARCHGYHTRFKSQGRERLFQFGCGCGCGQALRNYKTLARDSGLDRKRIISGNFSSCCMEEQINSKTSTKGTYWSVDPIYDCTLRY